MNIARTINGDFQILASREELAVLSNCMNETCNGLPIEEFQTRVGIDIELARKILDTLYGALT